MFHEQVGRALLVGIVAVVVYRHESRATRFAPATIIVVVTGISRRGHLVANFDFRPLQRFFKERVVERLVRDLGGRHKPVPSGVCAAELRPACCEAGPNVSSFWLGPQEIAIAGDRWLSIPMAAVHVLGSGGDSGAGLGGPELRDAWRPVRRYVPCAISQGRMPGGPTGSPRRR